MHILNNKKTKELIWHRDQYFHGKNFIGPKFKLYKLAIYFQDTNKCNGVTGFIPKFISPRLRNRYLDTISLIYYLFYLFIQSYPLEKL